MFIGLEYMYNFQGCLVLDNTITSYLELSVVACAQHCNRLGSNYIFGMQVITIIVSIIRDMAVKDTSNFTHFVSVYRFHV